MGQHFTLGAGPVQIMGQHVLPRLYGCRRLCRRAFQVSQGGAETLFRWGGKHLQYYDFMASLFMKLYTEFYQNFRSFVEDITKKNIDETLKLHTISTYFCLSYFVLWKSFKPSNSCSQMCSVVLFNLAHTTLKCKGCHYTEALLIKNLISCTKQRFQQLRITHVNNVNKAVFTLWYMYAVHVCGRPTGVQLTSISVNTV